MIKSKKKTPKVSVYSNLATKRRAKKDSASRKKAEYLATLPKHPVKRFFYRLHPKRVAAFWFSKKGLFALLKTFGVMAVLMGLMVLSLFAYYRKDLDAIRPSTLSQRVRTTVTKYYDRNDKLLWEDKGDGDYTLAVDPKTIAPCMAQATVAIEDKDFYKHGGVSLSGIIRAVVSNSQGNAIQGGSTLTQQLVKQVFFADQALDRGLAGVPRKIKEMIISIEVERLYSKEQIIGMYLNESSYGGRRNGVESGARAYFHKSAKDLTLPECALLAAIPNNPAVYDPYNVYGHDALLARQRKVLDDMQSMGYITEAQAKTAKEVAILDTIQPLADQLDDVKSPHFVLMVRSQLEKELGKTVVGSGGLTVKTSLDLDIQTMLEDNMQKIFNGEMTDRNCGYTNCANYAGFTNGASVIEDTKTGQIVALLGSRDFRYAGFGQDNATIGFIQPGSTIKPLVYAQLFQDQGEGKQNFGSGSVLADTKTSFPGWSKVQNADGKFQGSITIRQALDRSRNIPAIKAMAINEGNKEGSTWDTIRRLGDKSYCTQGPDAQAGLSSSIGGCGAKMTEHVNAIASLGRMGAYMPQSTVLKVTNSSGQVLKSYKSSTTQVIDPQSAYIVTDILGDPKARAGLGWNQDYLPSLTGIGVRAAAKTGTSNAEVNGTIVPKDIWTVGYTPSLTMAVWLGNPDTKPLRQGNSLIPAMFFDKTMTEATKIYVNQGKASFGDWFSAPNGIQEIKGELYPSYYNKAQGATNTNLVFDKVSKKKATKCTPELAKIEIAVIKNVDPYTKKDNYTSADGYDGNSEDDVHSCDDQKPAISLNTPSGKSINVSVATGKYTLQSLVVTCGNLVLFTQQISSGGTYPVDLSSISSKCDIVATATDTAYYTTQSSAYPYSP